MSLHRASPCKCEKDIGMSMERTPQLCEHKNVYHRVKQLARSPSPAKPRKGMKKGKGFAASKAQREKVRGLACVGCGREASEYWSIDAAHVTHRGVGGCQTDPLCVVPLCRLGATARGCHPAFDRGELDLLPRLIDNGYYAEMAHAIEAHELSPLTLLERLTGSEWAAVERLAA